MEPIYLLHGPFDRPAVFFRTGSEQVAKRLIGLLDKKYHDQAWNFTARTARDQDEAILFEEEFASVQGMAEGAESIFGSPAPNLPPDQQQLVSLYQSCDRWERAIREQEQKQQLPAGPYYIARRWWEEGYSGTEAVYRVDDPAVADELAKAVNTRFASDPHDAFENGTSTTYVLVAAADVPSRVVWDEAVRRLAGAEQSGATDGDAEVHAACVEWEKTLRDAPAKAAPLPAAPATEPADTAVAEPAPLRSSRFGDMSPVDVYWAAETCNCIFGRLHSNRIMFRATGEFDYPREEMNKEFKLAEKHGYVLAAAARAISLDPAPVTRVLRDDRLWEWPNEPGDAAILCAAVDIASRMITEARVECAARGLDPNADVVSEPAQFAAPDATDARPAAPLYGVDATTLVASADTFLGGIGDFAACVTTGGDKRDPELLYAPLEKAGYALLRAGRAWGLKVDLLDRLLRVVRVEGLPYEESADAYGSYEARRKLNLYNYLTALKAEVYAIRHEALLLLPATDAAVPVLDEKGHRDAKKQRAAAGADDLVSLDEAAAIVHRSKKTLERYLSKMPAPHVQGGGGKPSLWKWDDLRPWLEQQFVPDLPKRFPRNVR